VVISINPPEIIIISKVLSWGFCLALTCLFVGCFGLLLSFIPLEHVFCFHLGMVFQNDSVPVYENHLKVLKCCGIFKQGNGTPRLFRGNASSGSVIHIQRLSPENKGALPYIPLQAGYKSKKQSLTHTWLLVMSLATSSSVLCDCFHVLFL
jgi:hypothetical protein